MKVQSAQAVNDAGDGGSQDENNIGSISGCSDAIR